MGLWNCLFFLWGSEDGGCSLWLGICCFVFLGCGWWGFLEVGVGFGIWREFFFGLFIVWGGGRFFCMWVVDEVGLGVMVWRLWGRCEGCCLCGWWGCWWVLGIVCCGRNWNWGCGCGGFFWMILGVFCWLLSGRMGLWILGLRGCWSLVFGLFIVFLN